MLEYARDDAQSPYTGGAAYRQGAGAGRGPGGSAQQSTRTDWLCDAVSLTWRCDRVLRYFAIIFRVLIRSVAAKTLRDALNATDAQHHELNHLCPLLRANPPLTR